MKENTKSKKVCPLQPIVPSNSNKIKPGNNFYKYINSKWLRGANIEPFQSSTGVSQEMQDIIDNTLYKIIKDCRQKVLLGNTSNMTKDEISLGRFSESVLRDKYQNNNVDSVKELLGNLQCMRDEIDIARTLGELCHTRTNNLLSIYSGPEETSSKHWRLHISPGSLGLPHAAYYAKKVPGGTRAFMKYSNILRDAGNILGVDNLDEFASIETSYAEYIDNSYIDEPETVVGSSLVNEYKYIPWNSFWSAYNLTPSQWTTMKFVVDSPSWLHHVNSMFRELNIDKWRKMFQGMIVVHFLDVLPSPFDDMHYRLYSRLLRGEKRKIPQERFMLNVIKLWLTVSLSRAYMKCCMSLQAKKEIYGFTKSICKAAEERLRMSWLEKKTRKEAIKKVRNVKAGVMYPDTKFNYEVPELMSDNLVKNILLLGISRSDQEVRDVQQRFASQTWENPVFMVNAFYLSAGNKLVLPAGIVQWPFYCSGASIGWNYGGLGAVIGHELTHAFDTDGKLFDSNGNRRDWWSAKDNRIYNKKAYKIVKMFSTAEIHGHKLDAVNTLMENIADLGGLAATLDALKYKLDAAKVSDEERQKQYRDFFKSFAVSWREKIRRETELQKLLIDSHSPPELRVNLIVPHFQEWYDAYNIKPTDIMYIPPEKRLTIF